MTTDTVRDAAYRRIPVTPQARVVVDNDYAGDPDGLLALAHHLLADAAVIRAITCTSIAMEGMPYAAGNPARLIAEELVRRLGVADVPVSDDVQVRFDELTGLTDGARLILEESRREDELPLFVACGGPLTHLASALREDPTLAERMELVWIGGGAYPDGAWEYNLKLDVAAARFVFNESRARIVQVPQHVYRQCLMSVAELEAGLRRSGEFGSWLYDRFTSPPDFIRIGGIWPMGDSPPVLITALGTESSTFRTVDAPWIDEDGLYARHPDPRPLVVYDTVDVRLMFADFFARLDLHAAGQLTTERERS
ncbi:nucleoside hydrolase [Microbacterium sp. SS28]|uniref:nucleoside hydrolase n=1 Tax=Microbacterium sp. SS28 TaxID=2919948 RepID=UPI001FAA667B|nr:nucleoside hydrolase [Microbacterium sp. SS28]